MYPNQAGKLYHVFNKGKAGISKMASLSRSKRSWIAVIACAAGVFWPGAFIFGFPGVMGEIWKEMFNAGRAETSRIVMFSLIALGSLGYICGRFQRKYGTKVCFNIGTVFTVLSLLISLLAKSIYMVYIWAFLNGIAITFIYSPALSTVQKWVPHHKGFVSGIVSMLFGISAAIMSPVFKLMLSGLGYVKMHIVLIGLVLVFNSIAAYFCEAPEHARLSERQSKEQEKLLTGTATKNPAGFGSGIKPVQTGSAVKTIPFWCLCAIWVFMGAAGISMVSIPTAYSASIGLSGGVTILSAYNITNGLSRIVVGVLFDKIGGRITGFFAFILAAAGFFGLIFAQSFVLILILVMAVGLGFGTLFAISPPMISTIYGASNFGTIFGLVFMSYGFLGGFLGPYLYGIVFQTTGSYVPVFIYLGIFAFLSAVLVIFIKPLKQRSISAKKAPRIIYREQVSKSA